MGLGALPSVIATAAHPIVEELDGGSIVEWMASHGDSKPLEDGPVPAKVPTSSCPRLSE